MRRRLLIGLGALALGVAPSAGLTAPLGEGLSDGSAAGMLRGIVTLVWGDGHPDDPLALGPVVVLTDSSGRHFELLLAPETVQPFGGILALNHKSVTVSGSWMSTLESPLAEMAVQVERLELDGVGVPAAPAAVTGPQAWVSILCKFSDVAAEPEALSYFQNMYGGTAPQLDHYWREVSYENVNVAGSGAFGWYTLPQPRSFYIGSSANLSALFSDCTAAADPDVYFPAYVGINMMFNANLDCCAWGGSRFATLDGVTRSWRTTWEPPWGYQNVGVMGHEMGHGFGLPHSTWPGAANVYDNSWDVMSNAWLCNPADATYGCKAQHTISYHKDILGWFRPPEKVTVASGESTTVFLERLALPEWPITKMVRIPIAGSATNFYTVEPRRRTGSYDVQLPGDAIVLHNVLTGRAEPAHLIGTDGGAGAMYTAGELFRDQTNNIGVGVMSSTAGGFLVSVANGSTLAASFPSVDAASGPGTVSNVNGVLEPGETVEFGTAWANVDSGSVSASGTVSGFAGPGGATYTIVDNGASFGTIAPVTTSGCQSQTNCYVLQVTTGGPRPAPHWDATLQETLSTGAVKTWTLHLGNSFTDVPITYWAYPNVESLLHSGITAGCASDLYCPGSSVTRWQMAVLLARALMGSDGAVPTSGSVPGLGTYNCTSGGTSVFADVPPTDSGCKHIHYIASRGITSGCGGGNFCPGSTLPRWQMGMFLAKAMAGTAVPTSGSVPGMGNYDCVGGGASVFADVLPTATGCKEIHFLAAKQVTLGCGGGNYCPNGNVLRSQMAAFLTRAFRLALYRP